MATAVAGLTGCAGPLNHEAAIGGSVQLEAYSLVRPSTTAPVDMKYSDTPSVRSLDRSEWQLVEYRMPVDAVLHQPTYATAPNYVSKGNARQRGLYPTADTATDTVPDTDDSRSLLVAEAAAWPFWAGFDILAMLPRMFIVPPWDTVHSPYAPMRRATAADTPPLRKPPPVDLIDEK